MPIIKAFVRPKLEYASAVWDPHTRTQINQIEKVQRRAARYVTNRYHNTSSVTDMLHNLNWPSLEIRRTRVRLIMFYKIIHHVVAIHPLDTLLLPTTTITRYNSSPTYQHIRTDKDSYGPFLLKLPYYHQNMTLVLDIFCFYKFDIFLHDNGQVYLS